MATVLSIGSVVTLMVSDPWDFGTEHGNGPFLAAVVGLESKGEGSAGAQALLRLQTALDFEGVNCEYLIARARHQGDSIRDIVSRPVFCNLTVIPSERALSATPFDLSWWRGGVGLIATVSLQ
jgi:hypothetical protein